MSTEAQTRENRLWLGPFLLQMVKTLGWIPKTDCVMSFPNKLGKSKAGHPS